MKKIIGCLAVMFLPFVFMVGCNSNSAKSPTSPEGPTSTFTSTPIGTPTPTQTGTITPMVTATPQAARTPVVLGSAANFSVLAFSAITNTGSTALCGDLGLWSGTSAGAGYVFCGGSVMHVTDTSAQTAQGDLTTAINDAFGRTTPALIAGDLGGLTLYRGLYKATSAIQLTGDLTLDAQSDSTAVFIFQVAGSFTTAVSSNIFLVNGAKAANVFWQVSSNCSLGNYSTFKGTIMTGTATTIGLGVNLEGRALAKSGVTMQADTINVPTP